MSTLLSKWSSAGRTCYTAISLRVQSANAIFWDFVLLVATILSDDVVGEILCKADLSSVVIGELRIRCEPKKAVAQIIFWQGFLANPLLVRHRHQPINHQADTHFIPLP